MLFTPTNSSQNSLAINTQLFSSVPEIIACDKSVRVSTGSSICQTHVKSVRLIKQNAVSPKALRYAESQDTVMHSVKERKPCVRQEDSNCTTSCFMNMKTIAMKKNRTQCPLSDVLQMAIDACDESKYDRERHLSKNVKTCPLQGSATGRLQKSVSVLREALQASQRNTAMLSKKLKDAKESSRNLSLASSLAIEVLNKEIKRATISVRKEQTKRNVARRNSYEFVSTLKHGLSDIPDDKDELENESVWEVNMKLSMIRKMKSDLTEKSWVVKRARQLTLEDMGLLLEKCHESTSQADAVAQNMLRLLCARTGQSNDMQFFDWTRPIGLEEEDTMVQNMMMNLFQCMVGEAALERALESARCRISYFRNVSKLDVSKM